MWESLRCRRSERSGDPVTTRQRGQFRPQLSASTTALAPGTSLSGWAALLGQPRPETGFSRRMAHVGALVSYGALLGYLAWRITATLPAGGWNRTAAWILIAFEAIPLFELTIRTVTLWNIDTGRPERITEKKPGFRAAVFIPTYNEPAEVIAPTIAASCRLQPEHQTWVLDDGDRPWVEELCAQYGARYVRREVHDHAKAGNMNHALAMMAAETEAGAEPIDVVAVLDCDHVPLPTFLTDTLGWFADPKLALVQGPQCYYNAGAFDDDGDTGEQGVFFHVFMPGRNHDGAGPFWCGSTSLIRVEALQQVGGISTATIVEDMHTTLVLIRAGWKTAYHHQALAVGLAPDTPEQYLLQRRRWGMGSMQVLTTERLWAAKRWLSWRNYYEYLSGTLWWLEGVATVGVFLVPLLILVSGAVTSRANPWVYVGVFLVAFLLRLWGAKRLLRMHVDWRTSFALRILRVPVGISCLWWLITRRTLQFQVTPKSGAEERLRGRVPRVIWLLAGLVAASAMYSILGLTGLVPWHATPASTVASGVWLVIASVVLLLGAQRIQAVQYATTRRNAYRAPVNARVTIAGVDAELIDLSLGGAAVVCPKGALDDVSDVQLTLPGAEPVTMTPIRIVSRDDSTERVSLRVNHDDWSAYKTLALWLFHTPSGVVDGLPDGVPAVAARGARGRRRRHVLERQYGKER